MPQDDQKTRMPLDSQRQLYHTTVRDTYALGQWGTHIPQRLEDKYSVLGKDVPQDIWR